MVKNVSASQGKQITIYFEDQPVQVEEGVTVAAAVLKFSEGWTRSSYSGRKCEPFCHMGVCFECLMMIDGVPNQQACLTTVAEGMRVNRQLGVPDMSKGENSHA